jgi:hypothetical protein
VLTPAAYLCVYGAEEVQNHRDEYDGADDPETAA